MFFHANNFSSLISRYKREARSYFEIFQSVGVDNPSQILFITDIYEEAVAAKAAGKLSLMSCQNGFFF